MRPAYRTDTWEIPGGGLEAGEFPWQAARREAQEELGLDLQPGRLLVVDWVPEQPDGRPALSNYLFDGGLLDESEARQRIRLQTDEVLKWQFAGPQDWERLLIDTLLRRVRACAEALTSRTTAYLHHGRTPQ